MRHQSGAAEMDGSGAEASVGTTGGVVVDPSVDVVGMDPVEQQGLQQFEEDLGQNSPDAQVGGTWVEAGVPVFAWW